MGLLYPWDAVREDHIPNIHDFGIVAEHAMSELAARPRIIKGAAIIGSLPRGDVSIRSDLDLIVVCEDHGFEEAQSLIQHLRRDARDTRVILDTALWKSQDAWLGRHTYGPSYADTFRTIRDTSLCFGSIDECFRFPSNGNVKAEMLQKMERKLRSTRARQASFLRNQHSLLFINTWLDSSWRRVVRPLRVYVTLGRRLLWWKMGKLEDDGKRVIADAFLREPEFHGFSKDFQGLIEIDAEYDRVLTMAREGSDKHWYLRRVRDLLKHNFETSTRLLSNVVGFMSKWRDADLRKAA